MRFLLTLATDVFGPAESCFQLDFRQLVLDFRPLSRSQLKNILISYSPQISRVPRIDPSSVWLRLEKGYCHAAEILACKSVCESDVSVFPYAVSTAADTIDRE
jgi:hypothetical protein